MAEKIVAEMLVGKKSLVATHFVQTFPKFSHCWCFSYWFVDYDDDGSDYDDDHDDDDDDIYDDDDDGGGKDNSCKLGAKFHSCRGCSFSFFSSAIGHFLPNYQDI